MKKIGMFLILIFIIIMLRTILFNEMFSYEIIGERKIQKIYNNQSFLNNEEKNVEEIINRELKKSSSMLEFSFDRCENDPNKLINLKKANCIGYSAFLAASINEVLKFKNINREWVVKHKVGNIYFFNININSYFNSGFFQNHDFVIVENVKTKEIIVVDPSLYDYFKIGKVTIK